MEIQSFVLSNVIPYPGEQDKVEEALGHAFLQVRGENPSFGGKGGQQQGDPRSLDGLELAL